MTDAPTPPDETQPTAPAAEGPPPVQAPAAPAAPAPPPRSSPVTPEERRQLIDTAVNEFVGERWRIESRSEFQVVFVRGHRPNHVLHMFLTIFTAGLWLFVWAGISIFGGERRMTVSVDEYGTRRQTEPQKGK